MNKNIIKIRELGKRTQEKRNEKGLKVDSLADLANVDRTYLSNIENFHVSSVGFQSLFSIANSLDTRLDYLLVDSLENNIDVIYDEIEKVLNIMSEKNKTLAFDAIKMVYENGQTFGNSNIDKDEN